MPTDRERDYYRMGYADGLKDAQRDIGRDFGSPFETAKVRFPKKRKLSAWNKYVKANSKKPRFRMRSGKLNLKKMGVAFRKTPAGRKKKKNRTY
jgi:hypothetical protein